MRKLSVLLLAAALVIAFTMPAAAFENIFGGFWRVRAFTNKDFSGSNDEAQDLTQTDSRTRLYYTAKFSDDFQFVNKFEFDWFYGEQTGSKGGSSLGDIGADGTDFEIKNSYVDFNLLNRALNFKIGAQGYKWARSFMFDDDFSGAIVTYKAGGVEVPFVWVKGYEGGRGPDLNEFDVDYYTLNPSFTLGGFKINPFFTYVYSDDARNRLPFRNADGRAELAGPFADTNAWYLGALVDFKVSGFNVWGTGIYSGGDAEPVAGGDVDFAGYLFGVGASGVMGPFGIHGEFFYASGDDDPADGDNDAFNAPFGQSYYWAEIMGMGIFDNQTTRNSPGDQITNIWAANIGADYKLMPSLNLAFNLWYAERAEPTALSPDEYLGTEVDLKLTYQVMQNLALDLVGAYLFAGDGTFNEVAGGPGEEDPYEVGAQLRLSF